MNPATTSSRLDEGLQIPGAIVHDPYESYNWWNGEATSPNNRDPPKCCVDCCHRLVFCRPCDKYELAFAVLRILEFALGVCIFIGLFIAMHSASLFFFFSELHPSLILVVFLPTVSSVLMMILGCVTRPSHKFPLWQMILEIVLQSAIECNRIALIIMSIVNGIETWWLYLGVLIPEIIIPGLLISLDSYCISKRHKIRKEDMKIPETSLSIEMPQVHHEEAVQNNGHGFWHTIFPWY